MYPVFNTLIEFGSGSRVLISILKEKLKNVEKKNFLKKSTIFFNNYKHNMLPVPKEIFTPLCL